jgi:hypothetical protein
MKEILRRQNSTAISSASLLDESVGKRFPESSGAESGMTVNCK